MESRGLLTCSLFYTILLVQLNAQKIDNNNSTDVVVFGSQFLRSNHGSHYHVVIRSFNGIYDISVNASIVGLDSQKLICSQLTMAKRDEDQEILLPVGELNTTDAYDLEITTFAVNGPPGVEYYQSNKKRLTILEDLLIFVELSQPVFKPSDTVKYRLFTLDDGLMPRNATVYLRVEKSIDTATDSAEDTETHAYDTNNASNATNELTWDLTTHNGYAEGNFTLTSFDLEDVPSCEIGAGYWSLQASVGRHLQKKAFYVCKSGYLSLKLEINVPKMIVIDATRSILVQLRATYTSGRPVTGNATVTVVGPTSLKKEYEIKVERGRSTIQVPFDSVYSNISFLKMPSGHPRVINISATLMEDHMSYVHTQFKQFPIYDVPYIVRYVSPPTHFQKSVPFNLTVSVVHHNNEETLAPEEFSKIEFQAAICMGPDEETPSKNVCSLQNVSQLFARTGRMRVLLKPLAKTRRIDVAIRYRRKDQLYRSVTITFNISKQDIQLHSSKNRFKIEDQAIISVTAPKTWNEIEWTVVSKRSITLPKKQLLTKEPNIRFKVLPTMVPAAKLLVYFIGGNETKAASSFEFTVDWRSETPLEIHVCAVSHPPPELKDMRCANVTSAQPGRNETIGVVVARSHGAAPRNSRVGVLAVDKRLLNLDVNSTSLSTDVSTKLRNIGIEENEHAIAILSRNTEFERQFLSCGLVLFTFLFDGQKKKDTTMIMPFANHGIESPTLTSRQDFRQSFLFSSTTDLDEDHGTVTFRAVVPDIVTTWVITAFSLDNYNGLDVSLVPFELPVRLPFYVELHMPETALVDNPVLLYILAIFDEFDGEVNNHTVLLDIVISGAATFEPKFEEIGPITLQYDGTVNHTQKVTPENTGEMTVFVTARLRNSTESVIERDNVTKHLTVK